MSNIPYDSISRLVNYSYADERADFEQMLADGEAVEGDENHIFTHIVKIIEWLESHEDES